MVAISLMETQQRVPVPQAPAREDVVDTQEACPGPCARCGEEPLGDSDDMLVGVTGCGQ